MPASVRLSRFYRHLFLWVLQGWLAMFYIGAALAKLSQPLDTLSYLLVWPARVDPVLVQAIGWGELAMAIAVLSPLASWRTFRPLLLAAAAALLAEAVVMTVFHALEMQWSLAVANLLLAAMALTVLTGRRPAAERTDHRA
ncbi:hypothetical protein BZG35_16460 [Brevundimonas sp. LM2]|nr:hypothetical protein BZG35_16460 [Brevundimonas sp. LM2]